MSNYMAIIHKEPNGWYSAEVPALPGCYTDGATLDEIHMNLKDAIQLYLQDQPENDAVEDVEAAWDAEADRRLQEVLDGTAQLIPGETSMRRLDALLTAIG